MKEDFIASPGRARARWIAGVGLASAIAVLGYSALQVRAAGAPKVSPLVYSGVLEEDGKPVNGSRSIGLRLYDAASGGTERCRVDPASVDVQSGRFSLVLADACTAAIHERGELWVELRVKDDTLLPRTKIAAVPYALEAGRAVDAAGGLRDELDATKSALASVEARLAQMEQRSRPRVIVTRDTRGGCPGPYNPDTDALFTQTFSTSGPATIHTSVNIIAATSGRHDLVLYVDGNEVGRTLASPNGVAVGAPGDSWVGMYADGELEIGPGDHTIVVKGTAHDTYGCGEGWGHLQTLVFE